MIKQKKILDYDTVLWKLLITSLSCKIKVKNLKNKNLQSSLLLGRLGEKLLKNRPDGSLPWQQWRVNMVANLRLIAFISQTSSMTPLFYPIKRSISKLVINGTILKKFCGANII